MRYDVRDGKTFTDREGYPWIVEDESGPYSTIEEARAAALDLLDDFEDCLEGTDYSDHRQYLTDAQPIDPDLCQKDE